MIPFNFHVLLAALFIAIGLTGCGTSDGDGMDTSAAADTDARVVRVETQTMQPESFREIVQLTGAIEAPNDALLSAQTAGTVTHLVPIGTDVAEGDVVARLDDRLVRAALNQARANLESAESSAELAEDTFRRQEPLYQDSIISALEYENVRSQLNRARAELTRAQAAVSQAEQQLEYTFIRSPFAGSVEERMVEQGEQVTPGMPIARVVGLETLKVVAGMPERYAGDVSRGTNVDVRFKAYSIEPRSSTVSFAGNVIDPQNRTFRIEVLLENTDGALKPEMIADLFVTRRLLENQLVLPQNAVLRDEDGYSVYVVDRSGGTPVAARRVVEPGPSYAGRTVITSGIEPGATVIVVGQNSVTDGDQVEIVSSES